MLSRVTVQLQIIITTLKKKKNVFQNKFWKKYLGLCVTQKGELPCYMQLHKLQVKRI